MASVARRLLFALATSERFERSVCGLPGGEPSAYRVALRYVAGREQEDAFALARELAIKGCASSIDFFGESVSDPAEADRVTDIYVRLARALGDAPPRTFLSLDLSHIGIDCLGNGTLRRLERIAQALPDGSRVQVGAEQAVRADRILETVISAAEADLPVSATIQANLKRSHADAARLAKSGVAVRLVKGAYVEDPTIAHAWGEPTDLAFLELAHELHRAELDLSVATHDPALREAILKALGGVEVEMLLGVRPDDVHALAAREVPVRIYVPYGESWFRYAMRRLAESRGA